LSKAGIDKIQTMPLDALYAASPLGGSETRGDVGGRRQGAGLWIPSRVTASDRWLIHSIRWRRPSLQRAAADRTNLNEFIHGVRSGPSRFANQRRSPQAVQLAVWRQGAGNRRFPPARIHMAKPFDIFLMLAIASAKPRYPGATQCCLGRRACVRLPVRMADSMLYGRPAAFHSCEIRSSSQCGSLRELLRWYSRGVALTRKVSQAWVSFARTGDPNHSGLRKWVPSAKESCRDYFDYNCVVKNDPESEARKLMAAG